MIPVKLSCPKCGETMEIVPPRQVWISWCPHCGRPDYAYAEKPPEAGAGCPKCETPYTEMQIVGPFLLAQQVTLATPAEART